MIYSQASAEVSGTGLYPWTFLYDGTLGTLPEAQGWGVFTGSGITRTPGTKLELNYDGGFNQWASMDRAPEEWNAVDGVLLGLHYDFKTNTDIAMYWAESNNLDSVVVSITSNTIMYRTGAGHSTLYTGDLSSSQHRIVFVILGTEIAVYIDGVLSGSASDFLFDHGHIHCQFRFTYGSAAIMDVYSVGVYRDGAKTPSEMKPLP